MLRSLALLAMGAAVPMLAVSAEEAVPLITVSELKAVPFRSLETHRGIPPVLGRFDASEGAKFLVLRMKLALASSPGMPTSESLNVPADDVRLEVDGKPCQSVGVCTPIGRF